MVVVVQVLDGEMAQRAEATRQIREVQKRLMLLGDMVPPSPLVSGSSLGLSGPVTPAGGNRKDALVTKKHRLEQEIQEHNAQIQVSATYFTCTALQQPCAPNVSVQVAAFRCQWGASTVDVASVQTFNAHLSIA